MDAKKKTQRLIFDPYLITYDLYKDGNKIGDFFKKNYKTDRGQIENYYVIIEVTNNINQIHKAMDSNIHLEGCFLVSGSKVDAPI